MCFTQGANAAVTKCLELAETYYEQLYCEVKNKGKGKALPSFIDFKKNNEVTQALLLKRDAMALTIKLKIPKRDIIKKAHTQPFSQVKKHQTTATKNTLSSPSNDSTDIKTNCSFLGLKIKCNNSVFQLTSNKKNSALKQNALNKNNKMGIKPFHERSRQKPDINRYLYASYVQYIQKMLEIGLGGVTMTHTKFSYLFHDLLDKDVDFAKRFETMFSFLKKDKKKLAVSEKTTSATHLTLSDCYELTMDIYICDDLTRNYVYLKQ